MFTEPWMTISDDNKGNHIDLGLILLAFEEDNIHFFYSPAFDLTGYGKTEKEAHESFQLALSEFLRYTVNKKTLFNELERLGWKIKRSKKITSVPSLEDLASSNEYLAEILEASVSFSAFESASTKSI